MASPKFSKAVGTVVVSLCILLGACSGVHKPQSINFVHPTGDTIVRAPIQIAHTEKGSVGYRAIGHGPVLLCIMGYSAGMDEWDPIFIDLLARHFEVITFDNEGIGKTTLTGPQITITSMADQTNAFIETLGLRQINVLGWSMGGMVAQALANQYPNDVSHLVLSATLAGDGTAQPPSKKAVTSLDHTTSNAEKALLGTLFPPNRSVTSTRYIKSIEGYPKFYLAPTKIDTLQLHALATWSTGHDSYGHSIGKLKIPVLVADGKTDSLIPTPDDRHMASVIPGAKLVLYPDAAHAFLFQDAKSFIPKIVQFLDQ